MSSNCTLEETNVRERNLLSHIANMILAANENALVIGGLTAPGQQDCEKECFLKIIKNSETTKNIFFTRRLRLRMNGVLTATGQRENGGSGREGTASNEGKSHCAINLFLCWAVFFFLEEKKCIIDFGETEQHCAIGHILPYSLVLIGIIRYIFLYLF